MNYEKYLFIPNFGKAYVVGQIIVFQCMSQWQLTRVGNSLIAHSLILSKRNERLWGIRSDHSRQMSNCEQITQVAHIKRAIVSKSLRSLMTNEQPWAIHSGDKWANEQFARHFYALYMFFDLKIWAIRSFPLF